MTEVVAPRRVRYIKLGRGGGWEQESIEQGIIRFGFGSNLPDRFATARAGDWAALAESFMSAGDSKGTATRFVNETRAFFEDDGTTLWLTFVGERLYWGFLDPGVGPQLHPDEHGTFRPIRDGWRHADVLGTPLTKDVLSGALTKLSAYRGTSCNVDAAASDYVIRRINGTRIPEVERAITATAELHEAVVPLMRLLGPRDFELLVDLVFTGSGWRRLGVVGKTVKTLDLDLLLPSTGERAFVQVKSATTQRELEAYAALIDSAGPYERMFFVYHTGSVATTDERVIVIGPDKLAELVVDAGLVGWLIQKTS